MTANRGTQPSRLCVDANLAVRLVVLDEWNLAIEELWADWFRRGVEVVGPVLAYAEATSSIRNAVSRGRITPAEGEVAFRDFNRLGIRKVDHPDLHVRAWELARRYNRPAAYDMTYLALAELEDLDLWTGDQRLINALGGREPRVRWVPVTPSA